MFHRAWLAVIVVGVFVATPMPWFVRADQASTATLTPTACVGWSGAEHARQIDRGVSASADQFTEKNSAVFRYAPAQSGGAPTASTGDLTCGSFRPGRVDAKATVVRASVRLSLAGLATIQSEDVLVPSFSVDNGQTWATLPTVLMQGAVSNRSHDGYWTLPLPTGLSLDDLQQLQVRLHYADAQSFSSATVLLDGVAIDVDVAPPPPAEKKGGLKSFFSITEAPVIIIDKKSVDGLQLLDANGQVVDAPLVTEAQSDGVRVSFKPGYRIAPGTYVIRSTKHSFFRTTVTDQTFSYGIASINTPKTVYRPGDVVPVAMGVVDDRGKTVCNAALSLHITKPDASTQQVTTADRSIATASSCGPKSITDAPDYSAHFVADQAGVYTLALDVPTSNGIKTVTTTLSVLTGEVDVFERLAPTRINPKTEYVSVVRVTPASDFAGIFSEPLSAGVRVSQPSPNAEVITRDGHPVVSWKVSWQAGTTYEYRYIFDAPDVSPALHSLGPASFGNFHEGRTWNISADDVVRREKENIAFESITVEASDFQHEQPQLAKPTQDVFALDEQAHVKVFKDGFDTPSVPAGLNPNADLTVEKVDVLDPWGEPVGAYHASEEFDQGDKKLEVLHLVPNEDFHPGIYTVRSTISDGKTTATEETQFIWGVLVVNSEKSIYLTGETAKFGMAVLDATGKTLCQADLKLTVTSPSGKVSVFNTADNTIAKNYTCDVHSVTNTPDYSSEMMVQEVGTYTLKVESSIQKGQARSGSDQAYSTEDQFDVRASVPFDISRRDTATRLYPVEDYTAHLTVKANQDWSGSVSDFAPTNFRVYDISSGGAALTAADGLRQEIRWNVDWRAGQTYTLSYAFDPPNPSPRVYPLGPFAVNDFQEARQWQLAADATRVWDGGDSTANWSVAANWDTDAALGTDDTVVFDGSAGGTPNDDATWDASAPAQITSLTVSTYTGLLTITKTPATITGAYEDTADHAVTFTGSLALTIGANFTLTASGTFTKNTSTVTMTGTSNTINTGKSLYNLTIDPASTGTITLQTSDFTVSNLLTVAANDTLSLAASRTLTLSLTSGTSLTMNGTISGSGKLVYSTTTTFATTGTISSVLRFDVTNGAATLSARTYGGNVEFYNSGSTSRNVTLGTASGQTINFSGNITGIADGTGSILVRGDIYASAQIVNVTGSWSITGVGSGSESIRLGTSGIWTFSGSVNTSGGCSCSAGTIILNGSGTFDFAGQTLKNLTISGTYTFSGSGHIMQDGTLDLTGATLTPGTATLTMWGTSDTLIGGGNTLPNINVGNASAVTTLNVTTSNVTVNTTLWVKTNSVLSINTGIILTLSRATFTALTLDGTVSGLGTLIYSTTANFPTTGTISTALRYDASAGNQNVSQRTYGGAVELYTNSSSAARTITLGTAGSQTLTFSSNLTLNAANTQNLIIQGATWDPTVNVTGNFQDTGAGAGTETVTAPDAAATWTVAGNFDMSNGTWTASAETVKMTGTGNLIGSGQTVKNITIDGSGNTVTATTSDVTVSGTLTIGGAADGDNDTLTIASGRTVTVSGNSGTTLDIKGSGTDTINGPGTLTYQNSATTFPTAGTLALTLITRFDSVNGNMVIPARTDYGAIEAFGASANARTVTLGTAGSQTITTSGYFYVIANAATPNHVTLQGATWDPTLNIGGDFDFTGTGSADEIVTAPDAAATWTVSGSVDFTAGTYTKSAETLIMNGTAKTLTSAAQTLNNLTLSGSITLANETHTVAGDFSMAGGTITAGSSTVTTTGTANTITGGGNTLNNLTIDPASTGTITLQTSDLAVAATLTVASSDTLSINVSRTVTSGTAGTVTINGTISGAGTLTVQNSNLSTGGTLSSIVRFDATSGDITMPNRTYGGLVEIYNNSASNARVVTMAAGTHTLSGALNLLAANTQDVTLAAATNNPTVALTGDLDFTGAGAGTEVITSGTGTWTVSGSVDFTAGTYTATSGNTLVMNGSSKTLTSNANTLQNVTLSGTITLANATHTIAGDFSMAGGTITAGSSTVTTTGTANTITGGGNTLNNLTIDPSSAGIITLQTSNLTVNATLTVASGDTLSISAGRNLTMGTSSTVTISGTISGSGTLYLYTSNLDTNGTLTVSTTTFDCSLGNLTMPARSYSSVMIQSNDGGLGCSVTPGAGTHVLTGSFLVSAGTTDAATFAADTNNPTITIAGSVSFFTVGAATTITTGTGTWTISTSLTLTSGTFTATSGNTVVMDGTGNLVGAGQSLYNLTINGNGNTVTVATSDVTVTNTLILGAAADGNNDTLSIANGRTITSDTAGTVTIHGSGTDSISGAGTLKVQNSNLSSNGTVSSKVTFDDTSGNITMPARTYGAAVIVTNTGSTARTVTAGSGTLAFSSTLTTSKSGSGAQTLQLDTNDPNTTITGATTIGSGTTLSASNSGALNVNGNYTNNGTFTNNSGTVTLAGSAQQTLAGTMTSGSAFNTLTVTNNSGSDPDASPSVIFSAAATASTFNAVTASTKLRFAASTTYTFTTFTLNGQATGTRVALRSSSGGTQWTVTTTTEAVSYADVKDSLATNEILADDGTNFDAGNNNANWIFLRTLTVTLDTTSATLGTLSTATINKAAVVSTVTTNATNGYASHVLYDHKLRIDVSNDIDDTSGGTIVAGTEEFGAATSDSGNDIALWNPTACATGASTSDATALTASVQSFASASAPATSDATTLCLMASIVGATPAGAYSNTLTLVTTGKF